MLLENVWLARHLKPVKYICNQGNELLGADFTAVLERHNIAKSSAATKNPQANSIVERLHQAVANSLLVL
jgi:hypothetical protein